jgi:signal transduction histidine kinase
MGLRAKLASVFLALLVLVVVAISMVQIDRTITLMIGAVQSSGELVIDQTFEQIRSRLRETPGEPPRALARDRALKTLLESSSAFGNGVVFARILAPDGSVILASPSNWQDSKIDPIQPFDRLSGKSAEWLGPARLYALWGNQNYEMTRLVRINDHPYAIISVGLSTALSAAELRRSVREILVFAAGAVLLAVVMALAMGGMLMRPVALLATNFEALAAGQEPRSVTVSGSDELSSLAQKFNQLSQRINHDRTRWEAERGQYFNIFRSITDAVLLLDSAGAVLFANEEASGRLGLPAGGLTDGKPLCLLLGRAHPLARMVETVYATRTEVHDVALQLGSGENATRLLISIFSLGHVHEPAGLLVIVRDLAPVRELENVVDHSGRLARLGALLSGIAHQVRNPLNAMNLQLELMSQDAGLGKNVTPRLAAVRKEMRRLDEAIDALLRFMRPQQLEYAEIDLNELLAEVAARTLPERICVIRDFDSHVTPISADRALLGEALRNIADNAVEAMPDGGTLTLATRRVHNDLVEVAIADEGGGITPQDRERIFDLYFTTKPGGNGLGLALAVRAIDLHHGTLDIESEVGKGTRVIIRLPMSNGSANLLPFRASSA